MSYLPKHEDMYFDADVAYLTFLKPHSGLLKKINRKNKYTKLNLHRSVVKEIQLELREQNIDRNSLHNFRENYILENNEDAPEVIEGEETPEEVIEDDPIID